MPDFSNLLATRDQLSKHIDALVAASSAPAQSVVDSLTAEATVFDNDVVAATPKGGLDFSKLNASVSKLSSDIALFIGDALVAQGDVDALQGLVDTLDAAVLAATK